MTYITFLEASGVVQGVKMSGHSGYSETKSDIICASLSSAIFLVINTITDVLKVSVEVNVDEENADIFFRLKEKNKPAEDILKGLLIHFEDMSRSYPEYIKITRSVTK